MTTNSRVKIGGFLLGKELKAKFEEFTAFTSDERPSDPGIKMHAGLYFHAKDVWESDVGDIRVQFSYAGREGEQVIYAGCNILLKMHLQKYIRRQYGSKPFMDFFYDR